MTPERPTVLFTGIGLDGGPDIVAALRDDRDLGARIVGVDSNPDQAGRYLCDSFHVVPLRDEPGYLETVCEIAGSESANVIYPLPTFDQEIFAAAREQLASRGFAVPVSPAESVRDCNDKWLLYERLRAVIPEIVPETRRVESADDLAAAARELGYPGERVCIRRRVSRGAIGLRVLDAGDARLGALLDQNPGSLLASLGDVLETLSHAEAFPEYLVQEYLPGEEWDVDVLCRAGEPVVTATRRNVGMQGGAATRSLLERNEELAQLSDRLVAELRLDAIVNVAFKPDRDGRAKLLEINPRIPLSIRTAAGGGANLVALAVRQALGERIESFEPRWGAQFIRHFRSVIVDPEGKQAFE